MILKHNLILDESVGPTTWLRTLRPYLSMTPDIAALAKEIYYKENRFQARIKVRSYPKETPPHATILRPPTLYLDMIRVVEVQFFFLEVTAAELASMLTRVRARVCERLPNLKVLKVRFEPGCRW